MPDYNQLLVDPRLFFVRDGFSVDARTELSRRRQFDTQSVKTMTVPNGDILKVYDVTDPNNPVFVGTIG